MNQSMCDTATQPNVPQLIDVASDVSVAREAAGCVTYVRRTAQTNSSLADFDDIVRQAPHVSST